MIRGELLALFLALLHVLPSCAPAEPVEDRAVGEILSLYGKLSAEQRNANRRVQGSYRRVAASQEVVVARLGEPLRFEDLEAPGHASIEFDLAARGSLPGRPERVRVELSAHSRDGESYRGEHEVQLSQNGVRRPVRFEAPIELGGDLSRVDLTIEAVKPGEGQGFAVVMRPLIRFPRTVSVPIAPRKRVMLITLDTLRADHLGCYGNKLVRTPKLDELARGSVLFQHAFSTSNITNPSHSSIFTSLFLKDHGVIDNQKHLAPETPTLIDDLRSAGLRSAAFVSVSNFTSGKANLHKRFDEFSAVGAYFERRAEDVNAAAIPWLNANADRDVFVWLHYFDAHMPYDPPPPYDEMYHESGSEKIDMALDYKGDPSWFAASDELAYYHNRYMGEVSYLDEQLGRMFDHLRALGIFDSMLIVVVADHGEAFGEHGVYCEHRGLHDPVTRVPLFIKAPAQRVGGVVDAIVSTVDIYPTILDYLGRQPSGRVRGRSLRPLADAARAGERVPAKASDRAWSEHGGMLQLSARTPSHRLLVGFGDHDFFPRFAISQGNVELYPVAPQSGEGANLAAEMPELLDTLEREAEAFRADRFELSADEIEDEQYIERLRRLGYAE